MTEKQGQGEWVSVRDSRVFEITEFEIAESTVHSNYFFLNYHYVFFRTWQSDKFKGS